jgi:hypothetical protein
MIHFRALLRQVFRDALKAGTMSPEEREAARKVLKTRGALERFVGEIAKLRGFQTAGAKAKKEKSDRRGSIGFNATGSKS